MGYTDNQHFTIPRPIVQKGGVNIEIIGTSKVLTMKSSTYQHLNASTGGLNCDLPEPVDGAMFVVHCIGNAIMVRTPGPANIKSLSVDEGAMFVCNATTWKQVL
jgi:hypothetical protein